MDWNERNALAEHFFGGELPSLLNFADGTAAYAPESRIGRAFASADELLASEWLERHDNRVSLAAYRRY